MDLEVEGVAASPRRKAELSLRGKKCQVVNGRLVIVFLPYFDILKYFYHKSEGSWFDVRIHSLEKTTFKEIIFVRKG